MSTPFSGDSPRNPSTLRFEVPVFVSRLVSQPRSPRAPRSIYLSDGGVLENTGILALLQRRQRRILAVYTGEESVGQDGVGMGAKIFGVLMGFLGNHQKRPLKLQSAKNSDVERPDIYIYLYLIYICVYTCTLCYITVTYYFLF